MIRSSSAWIEKVNRKSDVRWRVRWREDGRKRSRTFRLRREAEAFLRQRVHPAQAKGVPVEGINRTFDQFLSEFLDWYLNEASVQRSTKDGMRIQLNHVTEKWRKMRLQDLKPRHIEEMLAERAEATTKQASVSAFRKALSRALGRAVSWEYLETNPLASAETPRVARKAIKPNRPVTELDDEAQELTPADIPHPRVARKMMELMTARHIDYGMVVALGIGGGVRFGEAIATSPADYDFEQETLHVRRIIDEGPKDLSIIGERLEFSSPKTEAGNRIVQLDPTANSMLREFLASTPNKELAFKTPKGGVITRSGWGRVWRQERDKLEQWCKEEQLPLPRNFTFHSFRHYHISQLVAKGMPIPQVSKQAGHRDPRITLRIYSHWLPEDREKVKAAVVGLL